ncbi:MAG: alkaline shock response membrane anchor protein AmaP [Atopobiaceae bacterium]
MGWFKRLCLFVFGLAGILALAALLLPWYGPYTQEATSLLLGEPSYQLAVTIVVGILALGVLICFLRSLFSPRNRKSITVSRLDGGQVTVTRKAIASQTRHIIERDGTCIAAKTHVRVRKRSVRVRARVTPKHALNVVQKGQQLHGELEEGLAGVCGDTLKDVSLVFTDPQDFKEPQQEASLDYSTDYGSPSYEYSYQSEGDVAQQESEPTHVLQPAESPQEEPDPTEELSSGITVRLHSTRGQATEDSSSQNAGEPATDVSAADASASGVESTAGVATDVHPASDESGVAQADTQATEPAADVQPAGAEPVDDQPSEPTHEDQGRTTLVDDQPGGNGGDALATAQDTASDSQNGGAPSSDDAVAGDDAATADDVTNADSSEATEESATSAVSVDQSAEPAATPEPDPKEGEN